MGYYNQSQICLNGHIITRNINRNPELGEKYCRICGAETICECLKCKTPIRGEYEVEGVVCLSTHKHSAPAYCHNCGEPYPWTEDALETTRMILDEEESLNGDEREKLKKSLPDLISDTPRTSLAVLRFKKVLSSVGSITKDALMKFAVSMACEVAKNQLGI